ncbi:TetR/AcrR family transcriptional regulator [Fodinicola feengrottensis]|uniref:HTH tetR-type domain-containing protein n=1 Tax=Fodinicola feengrottensis TaxID=435914 RepID=A0ABP4RLZ1_9ACTN|nr:TetR/AcrR family transcriptional regulator [Fodinicola feengrottensis]
MAVANSSAQNQATTQPKRRLSRTDRRDQILAVATETFARTGYAATSLDEIATQAGISRVIVYRHFASKTELYRAALKRICDHLTAAVKVNENGDYTNDSIDALLHAATNDPAGFRLLFRHAVREPEFRSDIDAFQTTMRATAHRQLSQVINDPTWATWASTLMPQVVIDAIVIWLETGQPDPDTASQRIRLATAGIFHAATTNLPTTAT